MTVTSVLSSEMFDRLLRPSAVTIVGASPNGHITEHLLRNLRNRSCQFEGPVNLVNPTYRRLFDLDCSPGADSIAGHPGLVYLLLRGEACMTALTALRERPDGVVLFPDASHEPGGYELAVAEWGKANDVAVLGPQSNGLVSPAGRLNGLLIPIIDDLQNGEVAVLAQSGGVLGGLVKFLAQRQIGIHSALEYGTACMLSPWTLGQRLLSDPRVKLIALYADGLDSIAGFAGMLQEAHAANKPAVVMVAGASTAAQSAIVSHSGMAATPRRVLEGLCAQHGAVLARDLDELAWSIEALAAVGFSRPPGGRVALFSDSGGGGIAVAEALEYHGVRLDAPFDFGSASMGLVDDQSAAVKAVAKDPSYGVLAFVSTIGRALRERSVHVTQLDEFTATATDLGRIAFVASPLPFDDGRTALPANTVFGNGSKESATKMRALATWAGLSMGPSPVQDKPAGQETRVITGAEAWKMLEHLPLSWPQQHVIASMSDLERLNTMTFPVVAKTEAGLAHRAREGGVLAGIANMEDLRNAVAYLLKRFRGEVSVAEQVDHGIEYFLGAQRIEAGMLVLLGDGGAQAESAGVRLAPLDPEHLERFVAERVPSHASAFAKLIGSFQDWLLRSDWIEAVDLNPIVPVGDQLVALDAKIHGR